MNAAIPINRASTPECKTWTPVRPCTYNTAEQDAGQNMLNTRPRFDSLTGRPMLKLVYCGQKRASRAQKTKSPINSIFAARPVNGSCSSAGTTVSVSVQGPKHHL